MASMSLDPEQYRSLAGFRLALRRFMAGAEDVSRGAGVTQQQYQAMLAIKTWPSETMTMGDLAGVYMKSTPSCPAGGTYTLNAVGTNPTCSVSGHTLP